MNALKEEIERKRKMNEDIRSKLSGEESQIGGLRFVRQGDRKRMEELQLEEQQRQLDLERSKRKRVEIEINKGNEPEAPSSASKQQDLTKHYSQLSMLEVKDRLRALRQPITLFAETAAERLHRLVDYMSGEHGAAEFEDIKVGRNVSDDDEDEAELEADDIADAADDKHNRHRSGAAGSTGTSKKSADSDDDEASGDEGTGSKVEWDPSVHFTKMPNLSQEKIVYKFFRALVKQWEADLKLREDHEKRCAKGRKETATQKQCKDYIRPLFRMCKKKEVPFDILDKLVLMVKCCEEGNFLAANDQYIRTAIGNSAWPIGLTMVGIHERSGREKISTSKVNPVAFCCLCLILTSFCTIVHVPLGMYLCEDWMVYGNYVLTDVFVRRTVLC